MSALAHSLLGQNVQLPAGHPRRLRGDASGTVVTVIKNGRVRVRLTSGKEITIRANELTTD